jgi:hypothetical protein
MDTTTNMSRVGPALTGHLPGGPHLTDPPHPRRHERPGKGPAPGGGQAAKLVELAGMMRQIIMFATLQRGWGGLTSNEAASYLALRGAISELLTVQCFKAAWALNRGEALLEAERRLPRDAFYAIIALGQVRFLSDPLHIAVRLSAMWFANEDRAAGESRKLLGDMLIDPEAFDAYFRVGEPEQPDPPFPAHCASGPKDPYARCARVVGFDLPWWSNLLWGALLAPPLPTNPLLSLFDGPPRGASHYEWLHVCSVLVALRGVDEAGRLRELKSLGGCGLAALKRYYDEAVLDEYRRRFQARLEEKRAEEARMASAPDAAELSRHSCEHEFSPVDAHLELERGRWWVSTAGPFRLEVGGVPYRLELTVGAPCVAAATLRTVIIGGSVRAGCAGWHVGAALTPRAVVFTASVPGVRATARLEHMAVSASVQAWGVCAVGVRVAANARGARLTVRVLGVQLTARAGMRALGLCATVYVFGCGRSQGLPGAARAALRALGAWAAVQALHHCCPCTLREL